MKTQREKAEEILDSKVNLKGLVYPITKEGIIDAMLEFDSLQQVSREKITEIINRYLTWEISHDEPVYATNLREIPETIERYLNEITPALTDTGGEDKVTDEMIEKIRQAFADYRKSEGCSCCRDIDAHKEAEYKLAELLKPKQFDDGSGFDWWQYCTTKENNQ